MANVTFSKNRETGEWDVRGPATDVRAGDWATVSRADGTTRRIYVATVSRSFLVNGVPYVYGVIGKAPKAAPKARKAAPAPTPAPAPAPAVESCEEAVDPNDFLF